MNSVSTATKLVPLCSSQKRASVAVSGITIINRAIYRSWMDATTLVLWRARCLTSTALPCRVPRPFNVVSDLFPMHAYRTHNCGALRLPDAGRPVRLSGWVHRKRDHGQLLFIDLRDHYGITQCVIDVSSPLFPAADALRLERVVTGTGKVAARSPDPINPKLDTGEVELAIAELEVQSAAELLPFPVNTEAEYPEDMRLAYRFLDLRREQMHANIMLRSNVIASIRQ